MFGQLGCESIMLIPVRLEEKLILYYTYGFQNEKQSVGQILGICHF